MESCCVSHQTFETAAHWWSPIYQTRLILYQALWYQEMSLYEEKHWSIPELVENHRPVLFFHPDEQFFPTDFEDYVQSATVQDVSLVEVVQKRPELNFYTARISPFSRQQQELLKSYHPTEQELANVPLFVCHKGTADKMLLITYAFMFNYGEDHFADLQYITIHLEKTKIKRIYFSRHDGGQWIDAKNVSFYESERPMIYVSKNNHACYPTAGVHLRYWGFCWDRCSGPLANHGRKWDPSQIVYIPDGESECFRRFKWMFYQGSLSHNKYIPSFVNRRFMDHIDMDKNYGNGCCWCM